MLTYRERGRQARGISNSMTALSAKSCENSRLLQLSNIRSPKREFSPLVYCSPAYTLNKHDGLDSTDQSHLLLFRCPWAF